MTSQTRAPSSYPMLTTPEEPPIFSSSRSARAERSWAGAAGGGRACTHSRMAAGTEARTGMAGVTHWAPGNPVSLGGSQGPLTAPGAPGDPCPSWGQAGTPPTMPQASCHWVQRHFGAVAPRVGGPCPLGRDGWGGTYPPRKGQLRGRSCSPAGENSSGFPTPQEAMSQGRPHPWEVMAGVPSPHESLVDGPPAPPQGASTHLGQPEHACGHSPRHLPHGPAR